MATLCLIWGGCSDDSDDGPAGGGGHGTTASQGTGGAIPDPIVTVLTPAAAPLAGETECKVTITEGLPLFGQTHVPICTEVSYQTNPPSSGDHWPVWAAFGTYTDPVPRQMLVHDLEHGAVVLAYRAGQADDASITDFFASAVTGFGVDPVCAGGVNPEVAARFVTTPDPELTSRVGVSAWRATYVATCLDLPSLEQFILDHYAKGPENFCNQGRDPADPTLGVTDCP